MTVLGPKGPVATQQATGQGAQAHEKKANKAKLMDVTEAITLLEEARRQSVKFITKMTRGGVLIGRLPFRLATRRKIKKNLAEFYDDPELVDEITERIAEAAQHDPFYKKLFG